MKRRKPIDDHISAESQENVGSASGLYNSSICRDAHSSCHVVGACNTAPIIAPTLPQSVGEFIWFLYV
jgi:hypothetical protein